MKLQFTSDEWLHILMAMRVAQKVLVRGEFYTPVYDRATGYRIIGELMRLVKVSPNTPQIAARIEAATFLDAIEPAEKPVKKRKLNAAGFPVDDDEVTIPGSEQPAPAALPREPTPSEPSFVNGLGPASQKIVESFEPFGPKPPAAEPLPQEQASLVALGQAVNQALQGLTDVLGDLDKLTNAHNDLAKNSYDRFLRIDEYIFSLEDKIIALRGKA